MQASTITKYLFALKRFTDFLKVKRLGTLTKEDFDRITTQIDIWNRSFMKDLKVRSIEKCSKDKGTIYSYVDKLCEAPSFQIRLQSNKSKLKLSK